MAIRRQGNYLQLHRISHTHTHTHMETHSGLGRAHFRFHCCGLTSSMEPTGSSAGSISTWGSCAIRTFALLPWRQWVCVCPCVCVYETGRQLLETLVLNENCIVCRCVDFGFWFRVPSTKAALCAERGPRAKSKRLSVCIVVVVAVPVALALALAVCLSCFVCLVAGRRQDF